MPNESVFRHSTPLDTTLPYTQTNIEGVDRYEDTIRLHTNSAVELSPGVIHLFTYEGVMVEHNIDITSDTILWNKTRTTQYIELTNNTISPPKQDIDKKEYYITHER